MITIVVEKECNRCMGGKIADRLSCYECNGTGQTERAITCDRIISIDGKEYEKK